MRETDLNILQKSLKLIADFPDRVDSINSANEFLNIHNRNLKMLADLGIERQSDFIKNQIAEYPTISVVEIEQYIAKQKKEWSLFRVVGGEVLDVVYNLMKTSGTTITEIKGKLNKIKNLNEKFQKIVEDPIYEELYKKTTAQP